jgi:hypothetical protein
MRITSALRIPSSGLSSAYAPVGGGSMVDVALLGPCNSEL